MRTPPMSQAHKLQEQHQQHPPISFRQIHHPCHHCHHIQAKHCLLSTQEALAAASAWHAALCCFQCWFRQALLQ